MTQLSADDKRHGTLNAYTNHSCRCDKCRDAMAGWQRRKRERLAAQPTPLHVHGTLNGYDNYSCRCPMCTKAHTVYARECKQRRAANVPEKVHGTRNGYINYACRCDRCTEAETKYQSAQARWHQPRKVTQPNPTKGNTE